LLAVQVFVIDLPLNSFARGKIDLAKITRHWGDILLVVASIYTGTVRAYDVVTMLQRDGHPTALGEAIASYGRIFKSLHILACIDVDETYRRDIKGIRNLQEGRHALARKICHGKKGELFHRYERGLENQLGVLGLVLNCVVLWNTRTSTPPSNRSKTRTARSARRTSPASARLSASTWACKARTRSCFPISLPAPSANCVTPTLPTTQRKTTDHPSSRRASTPNTLDQATDQSRIRTSRSSVGPAGQAEERGDLPDGFTSGFDVPHGGARVLVPGLGHDEFQRDLGVT